MKRVLGLFGMVSLVMLLAVACNQQTGSDVQADLTDIREEMQNVIQSIDEALATTEVSEFKSKTDDAVNQLDGQIDEYLNEMDRAERRIEQQARNTVIDLKQKKVEVEFKLALLEEDDEYTDDQQGYQSSSARRASDGELATTTMDEDTTTMDMDTQADREKQDGRILYGRELHNDIKDDLRDLRMEVEQFMQASLNEDFE